MAMENKGIYLLLCISNHLINDQTNLIILVKIDRCSTKTKTKTANWKRKAPADYPTHCLILGVDLVTALMGLIDAIPIGL